MAVLYVRSTDGNDVDNGSTWALAKATVGGALAAASAGDFIYVADGHAESQATTVTWSSPGTAAAPVRIVAVDDTGDPEPPTARATGASVTTTTNNDTLTFDGFAYVYGIDFDIHDNFLVNGTSGTPSTWIFDNCTIDVNHGANEWIALGQIGGNGLGNFAEFRDCDILFQNADSHIKVQVGSFRFIGGTIAATGTVPTGGLFEGSTYKGVVEVRGVDLSGLGSANPLVNVAEDSGMVIRFIDCKLGASVSVATGTILNQDSCLVEMVNCDSADTNYRYARHSYEGVETSETTVVLDASDGTTTFSRKMVSNANPEISSPMESLPISLWNDTVGSSQTATIEVVTDNVTLQDDEAWIELDYLGTSGFPIQSVASDRLDDFIFGTPANQPTSSASWTTTGLSTPVKQSLSVAFTAQEKGPIRARIMLARASTTMYYNPKIDIT